MPESLFVDETLKNKFILWSDQDFARCSLLVGQLSKRHYLIVHAVQTNLDDFKDPLREISEQVISEHSLNVTMMLPGGYWVLGICLISCEEIWNTEWNYKKCKIIMKNIRDKLMLNHLFRGTTPSNDLILLHFNPINEKSLSWKFIYNSGNLNISQLDIEFKQVRNLFLKGKYCWSYSNPYKELNIKELKTNQQKYWKYISKFEELVENSTLLLNGQKIVDKFDQIYKYIPKEKSSDDESEEDEIEKSKGKKYFQFFICLSKFIYNYKLSPDQAGIFHEDLFVFKYLSIQDVIQAIKDDLVRSWASRLHTHTNRLIECDGNRKGPMKKISVLLEPSEIPFYIYIFESEPLCLKRLHCSIHQNLSVSYDDNYLIFDSNKDNDFNEWIEDEKIDDEDADNLVYVFTFICFIILYTLLVCHGMVLSKYTE